MTSASADWLHNGTGMAPRIAWVFATEAELVAVSTARESGDFFAADQLGGLYRLNRSGRVEALSHGLKNLRLLSWSDTGDVGAAVCGEGELCLLDAQMNLAWSTESPCGILGVAIDAYGHNVAIGLDNCDNVLLSADRKKLAQFETPRPLKFLQFCAGKPRLCSAADHGLLCTHDFDGREIWSERVWTSVGDLSVTESGKRMFIAGFAHGVQYYDRHGNSLGSYVVEGTPSKVSAGFFGERLVVATMERHLYWLDSDGALLWAAEVPEDVVSLICDPLGEWLVIGFASGRVMKLDWENA
jgi:hypothetical protein